MSWCRTGKDFVTVVIKLHCLLRWLAGGSYLDIKLSAGISNCNLSLHIQVYGCNLGLQTLAYKFQETEQELNEAAQGFEALSSQGVIKGCMASLDGFFAAD